MGVAGEEAHGDVFVVEGLDAAAGECAGGVAANQEAEHHGGGRISKSGRLLGGFNASNYFIRQFRKVTGLSPRNYRLREAAT